MADLRFALEWPEARTLDWFVVKPATVVLLLALAFALRWLVHRAITKLINRIVRGQAPAFLGNVKAASKLAELRPGANERREQRAETMGSLLKSLASGVILGVATLMALELMGLPIGPLLASAGVLGLAIGFGAQALIKDFLAGVFMIAEDQYGVGDVVDLGSAVGTVESVGLRVTRLRDIGGTVWYVRNGEIVRVGNQSQHWARSVMDVTVAYDADLDAVQGVLRQVATQVGDDETLGDTLIETPEVWGVERYDKDGVVLRLVLKTVPTQQWVAARAIRARIRTAFDAAGLDAPASVTMATRGETL